MKITEKLERFIKKYDMETTKVDHSYVNKKSIKAAFFEAGAKLESPIYGKNCFIGAYSYMNDGGYIRSNVFVGRFCSIGRRVTIGAGSHSYKGVSTHPLLFNSTREFKSTVINNDVWIGDGTIIMPGVKIGQGAVIGANSVVTKDIPPYSIAVGQPCRPIKYRFSKLKINYLLKNDIFDFPINSLKELSEIIKQEDEEFSQCFLKWLDANMACLTEYDTFSTTSE